jgi:hypothetical protein
MHDESLTVVHCVNGRDLAAESLHAEGGHCVADITCGGLAIEISLGGIVMAYAIDLPGSDLVILSAVASMN